MLKPTMGLSSVLLSALSAVALIASFPPFNFFWLAWVALVPLLVALQDKSRGQSFLLVFVCMTIVFLKTLHWLSVFGWMAWIGSAFFQALFPAAWGIIVSPFLKRGQVSFLKWSFPAVSFVAMEAIRNLGPLAMPWGDLAVTQWRALPLIQTASLAGSLGVSFLIFLVNQFLMLALTTGRWRYSLAAFGCIIIPWMWGIVRIRQNFSERIRVALIQTNDLQTLKWDASHYRAMLKELDQLVDVARAARADLVFFPETALAGYVDQDPSLKALVKTWARRLNTNLAVGTLLVKNGKPQNAIVLVHPDGTWNEVYSKMKLVPFGEYLPWPFHPLRGRWHLLDPIVDFAPGETSTVFHLDGKRFGAMICFESSFGWMARRLVHSGSDFLAVSTNDAWFFETPAQETHAAMTIFRSVETGRSTLQAGNTGISLIADPVGRVLAWQKPNESQVVVGDVPMNSSLTLYDRIGDLFPYLCIGLTLLIWGASEMAVLGTLPFGKRPQGSVPK